MRRLIARIGLVGLLLGGLAGKMTAETNAETDQGFMAAGKNRAVVVSERAPFTERLDLNYLVATLVKHSESRRLPSEPEYLYQEVDPVPLESYKIYTPWLTYFKQAVVFVLGKLDPKRLQIAQWSVSLHDSDGQEVRNFGGVGHPPAAFYWNGRDREYRPLAVGQGYIPEITLMDTYGAKVTLPQTELHLDRFVWDEPRRLTAGFLQQDVFKPKQISFSGQGALMMQEISNLINLKDAWILEIQCSGPDADLVQARLRELKDYFARENLRLRKITVASQIQQGEPVVSLIATRPSGEH